MSETRDGNIAIILAGGVGHRMHNAQPKQYIEVEGRPIISYTLSPVFASELFEKVVICADPVWHDYILENLPENVNADQIIFSMPGETRQFTIFNALKLIGEKFPACHSVLIHDAARPLVTKHLLKGCLEALKKAEGVLPALKVKDTIYQSLDGKRVSSMLDRSTLYAGQSPEAFLFKPYLKAHQDSSKDELLKINGSSEIALAKGLTVDIIEGEENNFKITTPEDLARFTHIIKSTK